MTCEPTNAAVGDEPIAARRELCERCGVAYGELGLAIAFTASIRGDGAKVAHGWKATQPLRSAEQGRALMGTAIARNPIVVLGASNLIGIDVDGAAGRALAELDLDFPVTVAVRTGNGGHLWYRPPVGLPDDFVKIQLAETVTISGDGYFVAPPSDPPVRPCVHLRRRSRTVDDPDRHPSAHHGQPDRSRWTSRRA